MIKQLILDSETKQERKRFIDISHNTLNNIDNNLLTNHNLQLIMINRLFLEEEFIEKHFIVQEIKNKLSNYKSQDKKHELYDKETIITYENILEKMVTSKLKCFYCKIPCYVLYSESRYPYQWTLDRINNYDQHTNQNTRICCLKCNLQRRRINSEKFTFTKQLFIKKV